MKIKGKTMQQLLFRRLAASFAVCAAIFFSASCSRYLGSSKNPLRIDPLPEQLARFERFEVRGAYIKPTVISVFNGTEKNLALGFKGKYILSSEKKIPLRALEAKYYAEWNLFYDGLLGKLWFVTPASIIVGVGVTVAYIIVAIPVLLVAVPGAVLTGSVSSKGDSTHGGGAIVYLPFVIAGEALLYYNPIGSFFAALTDEGIDIGAQREARTFFREYSAGKRFVHWSSWFNPFQAGPVLFTESLPVREEKVWGEIKTDRFERDGLPSGSEIWVQLGLPGEAGKKRKALLSQEEGSDSSDGFQEWQVVDIGDADPETLVFIEVNAKAPNGKEVAYWTTFALKDAGRKLNLKNWRHSNIYSRGAELSRAISQEHLGLVARLLKEGVEAKVLDKELAKATEQDNKEIVALLLEKVMEKGSPGAALEKAVELGQLEALQGLASKGADLRNKDELFIKLMTRPSNFGQGHMDIAEWLFEQGACSTPEAWAALMEADTSKIKRYSGHPLLKLVQFNKPGFLKALLDRAPGGKETLLRIYPYAAWNPMREALYKAIELGDTETVELLASYYYAEIPSADKHDRVSRTQAFTYACERGQLESAKFFVRYGANVLSAGGHYLRLIEEKHGPEAVAELRKIAEER